MSWSVAVSVSADGAESESQKTASRTSIAIEALSRLKGIDLNSNPAIKAAVMKVLESTKGTPQFVELVREFRIKDQNPALLEMAINDSSNSTGVDAARLLLDNDGIGLLEKSLSSLQTNIALRTAEVLGNLAEKRVTPLLEAVVSDGRREVSLRKQAVHALAATQEGAAALLKLAKEDKLAADVKLAASVELNSVRWPKVKAEASQLLPVPQASNAEPLPPPRELLKRKGDAIRGADVFSRPTVGCINCHQVDGKGADFGPKLSEIGTKLGKDALFEAILDPSAGISFGFEAWQIELRNGDEAYGLIVSETADDISVKTQNGIVTRYKKADVAKREKMNLSIMPSGLQQTMSVQDLVDLVEYLASLKKAAGR